MTNEEANRALKAIKIADWIDAHVGDALDDDYVAGLKMMPTSWWRDAAKEAGANPPSEKTIGVVVNLLQNRLALRRTGKPFEGFPQAPDASKVQMRGCADA